MPDSAKTEYRWRGVYRLRDVADKIQRDWQQGIEPGLGSRWTKLNEHYLVKKRLWTAVTGIPSHGKSTWLDGLMNALADLHGWKFLIISPESQSVERHYESLIEIQAGKQFLHPDHAAPRFEYSALTTDELAESAAFVDKHFRLVEPSEAEMNIDFLLELAHQIKHDPDDPFDFDGIVIDPYNQLEHKRPNAMREDEYISSLLSKWQQFVKGEDVHGWIVAHPTKQKPLQTNDTDPKASKIYAKPSLYDISGGAHWYNKCDMGVVVYRNFTTKPQTTTIDVQKVKFKECGSMGETDLYFDFLCSRFVESESELLCYRRQ